MASATLRQINIRQKRNTSIQKGPAPTRQNLNWLRRADNEAGVANAALVSFLGALTMRMICYYIKTLRMPEHRLQLRLSRPMPKRTDGTCACSVGSRVSGGRVTSPLQSRNFVTATALRAPSSHNSLYKCRPRPRGRGTGSTKLRSGPRSLGDESGPILPPFLSQQYHHFARTGLPRPAALCAIGTLKIAR